MGEICVIGVGYVGPATGACLADLGNRVVCLNRKLGFTYRGMERGYDETGQPL